MPLFPTPVSPTAYLATALRLRSALVRGDESAVRDILWSGDKLLAVSSVAIGEGALVPPAESNLKALTDSPELTVDGIVRATLPTPGYPPRLIDGVLIGNWASRSLRYEPEMTPGPLATQPQFLVVGGDQVVLIFDRYSSRPVETFIGITKMSAEWLKIADVP